MLCEKDVIILEILIYLCSYSELGHQSIQFSRRKYSMRPNQEEKEGVKKEEKKEEEKKDEDDDEEKEEVNEEEEEKKE